METLIQLATDATTIGTTTNVVTGIVAILSAATPLILSLRGKREKKPRRQPRSK